MANIESDDIQFSDQFSANKLAARVLTRILWHMASECGEFDMTMASMPSAVAHGNEMTAAASVIFDRVLALNGVEIHRDLKRSIDSLLVSQGRGNVLGMSERDRLSLSKKIEGYFEENGYHIEAKPIYDILTEEMNLMSSERAATVKDVRSK